MTPLYTRYSLPVAGALEGLVLDHLNPVAVRIINKGHVPHPAVRQALLPADVQRLKSIASRIEVIDRDT